MPVDKKNTKQVIVGVLCLQGSFSEHIMVLESLGYTPIQVKLPKDLEKVTHLIIPGGESTVMVKLAKMFGLWESLEQRVANKSIAIMGTCAGAIICSYLGMNIEVIRNAYGAQLASGTFPLESDIFPDLYGTFIRAPRIIPQKKSVETLATWTIQSNDSVVTREDNFLALSFHPELISEKRIHEYFLKNF